MQLETVRKYQKIVFHKKQTSLLNVYWLFNTSSNTELYLFLLESHLYISPIKLFYVSNYVPMLEKV